MEMDRAVCVGERCIGADNSVFIIAEAGVNHNGEIELAKQLVNAAAEAGVDAVKFQTFRADQVVSTEAPKAAYQKETTDAGESQLEMVRRLELAPEAHCELQSYCQDQCILFMSTPFDKKSVDFLNELGVPVFKVGSGEVTNWPLLEHIALKGKPIILSTGMSYLGEVDEAVRVIRDAGNDQLVLLHCVSNYPADPADANLRAMKTMATAFRVPVGYSDHTPGIEVALAAVTLGASVVEKHFTLDKGLPGPDHRASLDPQELKALVRGIRIVESALGDGIKRPAVSEEENRVVVRRSLAARSDIQEGGLLTVGLLQSLRPASGISPRFLDQVVGRRTRRSLVAGELIGWEDLR
jgi:N-acetylneuraminate synthase/N,N'-diacetyllegionaminate synthase